MKSQILFFSLALSLTLIGSRALFAQDIPSPKPTPPFVGDAPAISGWKITMTSVRAHPPADPNSPAYAQWKKSSTAIADVLVSKSGDRKRIMTEYVQGVQAESYRVGSFEYEHKAGFVAGDVSVNSHFKGSGDFPELSWISLENYKDIESSNGKKYFVFRVGPDGALTQEAWIDVVTKLPLKFNDALYDRVYEFSATPPISVEPSDLLAKRAALDTPRH